MQWPKMCQETTVFTGVWVQKEDIPIFQLCEHGGHCTGVWVQKEDIPIFQLCEHGGHCSWVGVIFQKRETHFLIFVAPMAWDASQFLGKNSQDSTKVLQEASEPMKDSFEKQKST